MSINELPIVQAFQRNYLESVKQRLEAKKPLSQYEIDGGERAPQKPRSQPIEAIRAFISRRLHG